MNDHTLHINAGVTMRVTDGDIAMWDDANDKILRAEDITTPTSTEPFFDADFTGMGIHSPVKVSAWHGAPQRCLYSAAGGDATHAQCATTQDDMEPSNEPCTEEIPWTDLVYWLGNASTGQVECSCSKCLYERSHGRRPVAVPGHHTHTHVYVPTSIYQRLSAKIPVIAMPRIEGVN